MQKTFPLPFGARLVVQSAAAGRSVQVMYHPEATCLTPAAGLLIPNDLAGEICQAIEGVATLNEERQAIELPPNALQPAAGLDLSKPAERFTRRFLDRAFELHQAGRA